MRDNIVTFRVDADELTDLEARMEDLGYDNRAAYCRDAALGRIRNEHAPSTQSEYDELRKRVRTLEEHVLGASTTEHDAVLETEAEANTLSERIRAQLPKDCPEADAEAVVEIVRYVKTEGWASPQEIRDAVHEKHPAGKDNRDWWWTKMAEWLEHVAQVERVHQRRLEWVG